MHDRNYIRVLSINLTEGSFQTVDRTDLLPFLGGVGVACKLLD